MNSFAPRSLLARPQFHIVWLADSYYAYKYACVCICRQHSWHSLGQLAYICYCCCGWSQCQRFPADLCELHTSCSCYHNISHINTHRHTHINTFTHIHIKNTIVQLIYILIVFGMISITSGLLCTSVIVTRRKASRSVRQVMPKFPVTKTRST